MVPKSFIICFFIIHCLECFRSVTNAQTVIACGGFVKGPESMDFSRIEMRLFTVDGILKYQSFCAPHNGYYTVPVYSNGDYVLKLLPPTGWSFNPPQISIKIDGKSDQCSKQEDINFSFIGFRVSGKVLSDGSETGPEGLRLELRGENPSDVNVAHTDSNGGFSFEGIKPGKYKLSAVHLTWRFKENNIPIAVTKESIATSNIIVIGYDLNGSVMSGNGPIAGVTLTLFAKDSSNFAVPECKTELPKVFSFPGLKPVCASLSDTSGVFSFPPIPPGAYRLVPSYQNGRTKFSVIPALLDIKVSNSSVTVTDPFVISGFSISGRLAFPSGTPAKDVAVSLNGRPVSKTDSDGIYLIEDIKSGTIKLEFSADHAEFDSFTVAVTPENAVLPDRVASKIAACGKVFGDSLTENVEIAAKNLKSGAMTTILLNTKKTRSFCFMLESGDYLVSVEKPVDKFRPRQLSISLKDGPSFGASFEAFVATASGKFTCLEKSCQGIFLTLYQSEENSPVAEMKTTATGEFVFKNLHPGEYILKASMPDFCFDSPDGLKFRIEDRDVTDLSIKHTGYFVKVTTTHPVRLNFKAVDNEQVSATVELPPMKKSGHICLPQLGKYKVSEEKFEFNGKNYGCHFFRGSYPPVIDTNNLPIEIHAEGLLHLVSVFVQTSIKVSTKDLYVGIRFIENREIFDKISGKVEEDSTLTAGIEEEVAAFHRQKTKRKDMATPMKRRDRLYFHEDDVTKNSNGTFSHNSAIFWYATQIALEPKHPKLIFKPKMIEFDLDQNVIECPVFSAFFSGVEARIFSGSVTPATPGVRVVLTNRNNPEDTHVVWTEKDGTYSVGPLDPEDQYDADASVEGWEVQRILEKPGSFKAKRLGSINVQVVEDSGEPLEGALISISGPNHFRNNSLTTENGVVHLGSLAGGQYYAQAFRKEFSFEPRNLLIPLNSGEASEIKFTGTRVAFSCFGNLVSLNGEPEQGLFVIARSTDCEDAPGEEAETDGNGDFRILGLFPKCTYSLSLRSIPQLERIIPAPALVHIKDSDVHGVKLWAVRSPLPQLVVSTRLDGPKEFLGTLQVSLMNSTSGSTLHSVTANSFMLSFPPMAFPQSERDLEVRIEQLNNFASHLYKLKTDSVPVTVDASGFSHVLVKFDVIKRTSGNIQYSPFASLIGSGSAGSFVVAVLAVAVMGGTYFYASADQAARKSTIEKLTTLFTNPAAFFKSAGSPKSLTHSPSQQARQEKSSKHQAKGNTQRSPSNSSTTSAEDVSNEATAEQPKKRGHRSRLQ